MLVIYFEFVVFCPKSDLLYLIILSIEMSTKGKTKSNLGSFYRPSPNIERKFQLKEHLV